MKILIVDDHPLVRKGLEMVTALEADIQLAGFATNGQEALVLIEKTDPDVVLVDLRLPGEHGLDIIRKARMINKRAKYVVLSSYASSEEIRQAMAEKVDGYILKEALPEELINSIRLVSKGRKYFDPVIIQHAVDNNFDNDDKKISELTARELEVLAALAKGQNNKGIGESLFISEHTVKKHIGQILAKLNLKDRTQAALYAVSKGLHK